MALNPVAGGTGASAPRQNFEIKKRDLSEAAAKKAVEIKTTQQEERGKEFESRNVERRESIRTNAVDMRKEQRDTEQVDKIREDAQKQQNQDKRNPNSGNIVNVIV